MTTTWSKLFTTTENTISANTSRYRLESYTPTDWFTVEMIDKLIAMITGTLE
jgi:hypothetical protein